MNARTRWAVGAGATALVGAVVVRWVFHGENPPAEGGSAGPDANAARFTHAGEARGVFALASGAEDVLAVGTEGHVWRRHGTSWKSEPSGTHMTLRGVAEQLEEAIAVGDDGTILERAATWRLVPSPTKRTLRAVAYTSYGAIAVGDGGTIVRRPAPNEPWRAEAAPTESDLFGACAGLRNVWLVGKAGTILFRAPNGWAAVAPVTRAALFAVSCDEDHATVAVGEGGAVVERLDDVPWHEVPSGVTNDLLAVATPFGARSWLAVGAHGTAVRLSAAATKEPTGVDGDLRAVTEGALGTWVGGDDGLLAR